MAASPATAGPLSLPQTIVVDLDGTLVLTDTFASSLLEALRRKPECLPALIRALIKGRSHCKRLVSSLVRIDAASLPYNLPLIEHLNHERAMGRRLVLATGADAAIAADVAAYLCIFDDVIATL